jgi:proteasome lid subunit RPN8/RPN11
MLTITKSQLRQMFNHAVGQLPYEACGILGGSFADNNDASLAEFFEADNTHKSAKSYYINPKDMLNADRKFESAGIEIIGVMHSHTHTDPYPSSTDIENAPDPTWYYVIVSLKYPEPALRAYRIINGNISEEPVVVIN